MTVRMKNLFCLFICRDIIRKVERSEALKTKATLVSGLVEWQYRDQSGNMVPFDMYMNLRLEEALEKKQPVKIKINNRDFDADPEKRKAVLVNGMTNVELLRKNLKGEEIQKTFTTQQDFVRRLEENHHSPNPPPA